MAKKYIPIQRKLIQVIMLTCGMVLLLACTALFLYEYRVYRNIAKNELTSLAGVVAANSTASLAFADKQDAMEVLGSLSAQKHLVAAMLFDNEGRLFAAYPGNTPVKGLRVLPGSSGFFFSKNFLEGYQPVIQGNQRLGTLYLKMDLKGVNERVALYLGIILLVSLVSFALAFLFSIRLRNTIAAPILKLAATANSVSAQQDYTIRAESRSNDEVGQLTEAFNHMLAQIEEKNAEILTLNQSLEQKVAQRTGQLQVLNTELTEQKEFVETILDSSVDVIAVLDRDYRFVTLNKQADVVYKRSRDLLIGKSLPDLFPELAGSTFMQEVAKAFDGEVVQQDMYHSPVTGRYFQNFFIPIRNNEAQVEQVLVIGHEITELMESNARLRELNSDLEKSNRDLEQFAYVASHDLQEPLRKIQTFAELSEHNLSEPDVLRNYLRKISLSAARMSTLIRDVLNYSRLTRFESDKVLIDLNTILTNVKTDLELLIEEKQVVIHSNQLPVVEGSPLQMQQLFYNLLGNAIKFSHTGPNIRVWASAADPAALPGSLALKTGEQFVELLFEDNGIGFEQQYADKIFSIFQRLHTAQEYAGTGIGLALCKKIVDNHHGAIKVKSEPGIGSCFYIYLPLPVQAPQVEASILPVAATAPSI